MVAGRLKPGELLPSENQLAKEMSITRVTVRHAMASLENDGLIRRIQGKGTFTLTKGAERPRFSLRRKA